MARSKTPADSSLSTCKPDGDRVEQTVKWLLTGARDADVVEAIQTTWPDQELQPLIQAAVQQLAASGRVDRQVVRGFCIEATKEIYRRSMEIGDFAGGLRAIKQLWSLAA